jgi:hypothetical protein
MFFNTERIKDRVSLRAVTDKFTDLVEVSVDIKGSDVDVALCWFNFASQVFEGGRFSSSIYTE